MADKERTLYVNKEITLLVLIQKILEDMGREKGGLTISIKLYLLIYLPL